MQEQLKEFKASRVTKQFSNICIITKSCTHIELESALKAIGIRNKIVHEGLDITNEDNKQDFYNLLKILTRFLNYKKVVFPEVNPGNEFGEDSPND